MTSVADPLVVGRHVRKVYSGGSFLRPTEFVAVHSTNFHVSAGEILGLVGESGSGKSTLAKMVAGLLPVTRGEIHFDGKPTTNLTARQARMLWRDVQMIYQDPYSSLNPRMTVQQTLAEPLRNYGLETGRSAQARINEALDACGLSSSALHRYPKEFSGGQRQRIAIARALIVKPKFIVADEPVSALDVSIQAQIVNLLQSLQREFNLTYLLISHDLDIVRHIANRVAVMHRGRIVESGPSEIVLSKPSHPYTELLLKSNPIPDVAKERARLAELREWPESIDVQSDEFCSFATRCRHAKADPCVRVRPDLAESNGMSIACHFPIPRM
jgi:oligopeptide transport system ATP-binding protein